MALNAMPSLFIGHGTPMNALQSNIYTDAWRRLGEALPRPRAILSISAHWFTQGVLVTGNDRPATIHDFHGFPPELYECHYPAPGDPELARHIQQHLQIAGDQPIEASISNDWGLDHGTWSILMHLYPNADIPVLQLSIDATKPAEFHFQLGQRLRSLRQEGVLILASGNVVHNLQRIRWTPGATPYSWANEFNDWIRVKLEQRDADNLIHFERAGQAALLSVPTVEHYLPLLYAFGASSPEDSIQIPTDGVELGSISMLSALFQPSSDR